MGALGREVIGELLPGEPGDRISLLALPACQGDRSLLRQVLVNLIANAIKYSSKQKRPKIEIGHAGGAFYVKDNGVGFDMKYAEQTVRRVQPAASRRGFRGHGGGVGHRAARHPAARGAGLGRRAGRQGRHVLFQAFLKGARSPSSSR